MKNHFMHILATSAKVQATTFKHRLVLLQILCLICLLSL